MNGKQRRYLKQLSHHMEPIFQIGKNGVFGNTIKQFELALEARELVKATVLNNSLEDTKDVAYEIANEIGADVVSVVGHKFVLYKESKDNKQIKLPK